MIPKTRQFYIEIEIPDGANTGMAMDYIETAIKSWKGGMDPADPMFNLDPKTVVVRLTRRVDEVRYLKP